MSKLASCVASCLAGNWLLASTGWLLGLLNQLDRCLAARLGGSACCHTVLLLGWVARCLSAQAHTYLIHWSGYPWCPSQVSVALSENTSYPQPDPDTPRPTRTPPTQMTLARHKHSRPARARRAQTHPPYTLAWSGSPLAAGLAPPRRTQVPSRRVPSPRPVWALQPVLPIRTGPFFPSPVQ